MRRRISTTTTSSPHSPRRRRTVSRINVLLTGVDSAETRSHALTDTLMVASIDPVTHDVALVSFPRDISNFPMVDGGTYKGKINSYMTYVTNHPKEFKDKPLVELVRELSFLIGAPIHYYAAVDLAGFRKLIDAAGGVTVTVEKALNDAALRLARRTSRASSCRPGSTRSTGRTPWPTSARDTRAGDNDFRRAKRQQEVLLSLARKFATPEMIPRMPQTHRRRRRHAQDELPVRSRQRDARPGRRGSTARRSRASCSTDRMRVSYTDAERDLQARAEDGQAGRAVDQDLRGREHLRAALTPGGRASQPAGPLSAPGTSPGSSAP